MATKLSSTFLLVMNPTQARAISMNAINSGMPNTNTNLEYHGISANAIVPHSTPFTVESIMAMPMARAACPCCDILYPSMMLAAVELLPGIPVNILVKLSPVEDAAIRLVKNTMPK
jgi:hypothetical protein